MFLKKYYPELREIALCNNVILSAAKNLQEMEHSLRRSFGTKDVPQDDKRT